MINKILKTQIQYFLLPIVVWCLISPAYGVSNEFGGKFNYSNERSRLKTRVKIPLTKKIEALIASSNGRCNYDKFLDTFYFKGEIQEGDSLLSGLLKKA